MKSPLFILKPCTISKHQDTLLIKHHQNYDNTDRTSVVVGNETKEEYAITEEEAWWQGDSMHAPIHRVDSIHVYNDCKLTTGLMSLLTKHSIPMFIYNYHGYLMGAYDPRDPYPNGLVLRHQVLTSVDETSSIFIAKSILRSAFHNMLRTVQYYDRRDGKVSGNLGSMRQMLLELDFVEDRNSLMGTEGQFRRMYYETLDDILPDDFKLGERSYRPPTNAMNAAISFVNMQLYTAVISECLRTQLNPTIGVLHAPGRHRYPLAWDVAEVFRPLLSEGLIIGMVRKKHLTLDDFDPSMNYAYLNDKGRKKMIRAFESRLRTTVHHRVLKRSVSYRRLIRLDLYGLIKYWIEDEPFEPFKLWW